MRFIDHLEQAEKFLTGKIFEKSARCTTQSVDMYAQLEPD